MLPKQGRSLIIWILVLGLAGIAIACSRSPADEQVAENTPSVLETVDHPPQVPTKSSNPTQTPSTFLSTVTPSATDVITNTPGIRIEQYMSEQEKPFSGVIMVVQDDQILIKKGYGLANREQGVANIPQTKFAIGSITKSFTAAAIMILQQEGKLSVDDTICNYIEECPEIWETITLHHLLTHSSGIRNYLELEVARRDDFDPCLEYTVEEVVASFKAEPLQFSPGVRFKYSNSGYFLLGVVIEEVSSQSYDDYIHSNILQPLRMSDTGYDRLSDVIDNRATGYSLDLVENQFVEAICWDVSSKYAAGGLYSTVDDLYRWGQAFSSANDLLVEDSLNAIFTASENNLTIFEDSSTGYGWEVGTDSGHRIIEHGGQVNGFTAFLTRYPDDQVTIIVLSNYEDERTERISRNLATILFGDE